MCYALKNGRALDEDEDEDLGDWGHGKEIEVDQLPN